MNANLKEIHTDHDYIKLNNSKLILSTEDSEFQKSVNQLCNPEFIVWHQGFAFITTAVYTHFKFLKCRKYKVGCQAHGKMMLFEHGQQVADIYNNIHNHEPDELSKDLERFIDRLLEGAVAMPFNIPEIYRRISDEFPAESYLIPIKDVFQLMKAKRLESGKDCKYEKLPKVMHQTRGEDRGTWHKGYLFLSSGNVNGFKYLKCKEKTCPARGKIPLFGKNRYERIDIYKPKHNHPKMVNAEERKMFYNTLKRESAERLSDDLQKIYTDVSLKFDHVPNKKSFQTVKQTMKRARSLGIYNAQSKKLKLEKAEQDEIVAIKNEMDMENCDESTRKLLEMLTSDNIPSDLSDSDSDESLIEDDYTKIYLQSHLKKKEQKENPNSSNDINLIKINREPAECNEDENIEIEDEKDEIVIIQPVLLLKPKVIIKTKSEHIADATFNLSNIPRTLIVPDISFAIPSYNLDVMQSDVQIIASEDLETSDEVEIMTPQTDMEMEIGKVPELVNTNEDASPFIVQIPVEDADGVDDELPTKPQLYIYTYKDAEKMDSNDASSENCENYSNDSQDYTPPVKANNEGVTNKGIKIQLPSNALKSHNIHTLYTS